jgi:hypothetical protein
VAVGDRAPQSPQSVPRSQTEYIEFGPPSSHSPSLAVGQVFVHPGPPWQSVVAVNRPCSQYELALNVPEVRRPFIWAHEGDPKPPESISKSTEPATGRRRQGRLEP